MRNAKCEMRKKMKNAELIEAVKVLFWGWLRVERIAPFAVRVVGEHIENTEGRSYQRKFMLWKIIKNFRNII